MITSALINECRREFGDLKKSTRMVKTGDGSSTLFNTGSFPIIENSYSIYKGTSAQTETTNYTLDKDTGDLVFTSAPTSAYTTKAEFKYAHWRDANWVEAINQGIEALNARGFYKQVVNDCTTMRISANIRKYTGPANCIDLYQVLESDNNTVSGDYVKLGTNWVYNPATNELLLGNYPSTANRIAVSYLRRIYTYSATSATLDIPSGFVELVKKFSGAKFYKSLAGKVAKEPHANIEEGHFSFTNLRTMSKDMMDEFHVEAVRSKPSRPARDIQYHIEGGGTV